MENVSNKLKAIYKLSDLAMIEDAEKIIQNSKKQLEKIEETKYNYEIRKERKNGQYKIACRTADIYKKEIIEAELFIKTLTEKVY